MRRREPGDRSTARNLTALAVVLVLVGGFVADRYVTAPVAGAPTEPAEAPGVRAPDDVVLPVYCVGGSALGRDGHAELVTVLQNTTDREVPARLTAFGADGVIGSTELTVGPRAQAQVKGTELGQAAWMSVMVETVGGVAVEQVVTDATDWEAAPCVPAAADRWHLAAGSTTRDATLVLLLFNPFPDDAVVDISFMTEDGPREPRPYQALVVGGRSLLPVDVTDVVTRRDQVATVVRTRSGRLVVGRFWRRDGTGERPVPAGLSVTPAQPAGVISALLPGGTAWAGVTERVVVLNPTDGDAQVDVELIPDGTDPDCAGAVAEPYELLVAPGAFEIVPPPDDVRLPTGCGHAVGVTVFNDRPVVVERVLELSGTRRGMTVTAPAPPATRWVLAVGATGPTAEVVVVANPDPGEARTFSLTALIDGAVVEISGAQGIGVPARGRTAVDLGSLISANPLPVLVTADGPVTVERQIYEGDRRSTATSGLPVRSTAAPAG